MLNKRLFFAILAVVTTMTTTAVNAPSSYANPTRNPQQATNVIKKGQRAWKNYGKGAIGAYKLNSKACKNSTFKNYSPTCKK
ncbi:MAG: hypothetical protein ICV85_00995 [Tolypothrix sp. T3-bin4]|nr:hypothetical protein [Tolypothrix sp. T3-bin4]